MKVIIRAEMEIGLADGTTDPALDDPLADRMRSSVLQAVKGAIEYQQDNGFSHDLEELTGVELRNVSLVSDNLDRVDPAPSVSARCWQHC